ncbi:hypothetical protein E2C01_101949 [Portunus trituberculatus]|uniref:Uncharacterized protein n=1 Tax=Portunus trituberculatus TaxID=210409 RepID=A0A5B7KLF7_PORTR|nr:hypothetical protein [Portunus trituberculatus]
MYDGRRVLLNKLVQAFEWSEQWVGREEGDGGERWGREKVAGPHATVNQPIIQHNTYSSLRSMPTNINTLPGHYKPC